MDSFLDLLLYRHRSFKIETYFRNRFPLMLLICAVFAVCLADSFIMFLIIIGMFMFIDMILAFGAWLYYKSDL
jgi:hypothetical protein